MTSFLSAFYTVFCLYRYCNFYGAASVARPCSCRWDNSTRCAILCPLCKLFYVVLCVGFMFI